MEVAFPVLDKVLKTRVIKESLQVHLRDNRLGLDHGSPTATTSGKQTSLQATVARASTIWLTLFSSA
ncbi:hypothetical protein ACTMU2_28965 [Cupriavidus basilensis]